jgi:hypothetical protein
MTGRINRDQEKIITGKRNDEGAKESSVHREIAKDAREQGER